MGRFLHAGVAAGTTSEFGETMTPVPAGQTLPEGDAIEGRLEGVEE